MQTFLIANNKILEIKTRPEIELILCCARTHIDDEKVERIKFLIQGNINWQYLIKTAYKHGLMPLLYTNLNTICPEAVPEPAFKQLQSLFYTNAQRSLLLTAELVKILRLVQENEISAVPYKGPVLTNSLYGNVALRQFCDLDIVVQPPDVLKVKKLLIEQGYRTELELTEAEEIAYLQDKSKHTYNFIHDGKTILVEIHWRITPKYISPIEPKHFWEKLEPFSLAGITTSNLPLEEWLLILCVHGSRHRWEKLSWPCDIAQLIRLHPAIHWERVIQKASEFDCRRMLFLGLFLAHHLIGVTLPGEVLQQIKADSEVACLASEICKELLGEADARQRFMVKTVYHMRVRERWHNKLLYFELFVRWLMKDKNVLLDQK